MLKFNKSHGLGNDMIIIDCRDGVRFDLNALASRLCNRITGIGADNMLVLADSDKADVRMRIFNSDGTEAQMCGNGIRCFAKYVYDKHIVNKTELTVETLGGIMRPSIDVKDGVVKNVTVNMGTPRFERADIPMLGEGDFLMQPLSVGSRTFFVSSMFMTIPHTVAFVDDVSQIDVARFGSLIERHRFYPEHTNVNFAQVVDRRNIIARPWERGCGVTLACGTGACACIVACVLAGKTEREANVHLQLGSLRIRYDKSGSVFMTGPATSVFDGEIDI